MPVHNGNLDTFIWNVEDIVIFLVFNSDIVRK